MVFKYRITGFGLFFFISFVFLVFILKSDAEAIPPPELVRMGSVIAQVLAFFFVFFSTFIFLVRNKVRSLFSSLKGKSTRILLLSAPALILGLVLAGSAVYVRNLNRDILAEAATVKDLPIVNDGVMTLAGMQIDIADPSFKLEPQEAVKYLQNKNYVFIDIREPVEYSVRYVPGFINIRLGDLIAGEEYKKLDKTKNIVLICEVGERGSTISVFLRVRGYQAFYIDKGIRGWRDKKLKFVGNDKMNLPNFKSKYKTVSEEEARVMLAEEKAVLVDVRTMSEFKKGHVTGALNIPLVNMQTKDLEKALDQLPKDRLVIGISYDRFGSYYCKIVGYMIVQKNMVYGGTLKLKPQNRTL